VQEGGRGRRWAGCRSWAWLGGGRRREEQDGGGAHAPRHNPPAYHHHRSSSVFVEPPLWALCYFFCLRCMSECSEK
jgi:hypothetical protein